MSEAQSKDQISMKEIPKFQFEINNDELKSCLKEINFQLKTQDKAIQKMKKQVQSRPTINSITQALVLVNSLVQIDPGLAKLLKSKPKKEDLGDDPINGSSNDLGKKVNSISECVSILHNSIKGLEKKVIQQDFTVKSSLNEKFNTLQEQIDELTTNNRNQISRVTEKIELTNAEFGDKIRETETKTLWQINDCKLRLTNCINEQFVRDAMKELQGKTITRIKQQSIKQGAVDPQRVQKMQLQINKNQKEFSAMLTETNFKLQGIKDNIEISLMSKKSFQEQRLQIQKRFNLLNNNFADIHRRVRNTEQEMIEEKQKLGKLEKEEQNNVKQLVRMNEVLKNMKIGDDFQKMLQKMDPHKICALDQQIDSLQLNQEKQTKNLELVRKELDRLRSKTQFCNILTPNADTSSKLGKEEVGQLINEYFVNNQFSKKILGVEAQILELKGFPEMINQINKKVARMGKETDNHNLVYELRGLQEYIKKEILIVNNRINTLQIGINDDKKKRPSSANKTHGSESKLASSISYKKLTPVNCISCYQNPMTSTDKKGLMRRF